MSGKQTSIRSKLLVFPLSFVLFFAFFGVVQWDTQSRAGLGGAVFHDILDGKDLVADVLPPPCYLIESYLLVLRLAQNPSPALQQKFLADSRRLEKEYHERIAVWRVALKDADLREAMLARAHRPAEAFFRLRDGAFFDALKRNDLYTARRLANGPLTRLYEEQRRGVDLVVARARRFTETNEKNMQDSLALAQWRGVAMTAAGGVVSLALAAWALGLGTNFVRRLNGVARAMEDLSKGDLRVSVKA